LTEEGSGLDSTSLGAGQASLERKGQREGGIPSSRTETRSQESGEFGKVRGRLGEDAGVAGRVRAVRRSCELDEVHLRRACCRRECGPVGAGE
jgi:hypothetical protein